MAGALAAAMPWWNKIRPLTPEQRRAAFAPLWAHHLAHPDTAPQFLRLLVEQQLSPGLAFIEKSSASRTHTFPSVWWSSTETRPRRSPGSHVGCAALTTR
jgi:hypothetical protein